MSSYPIIVFTKVYHASNVEKHATVDELGQNSKWEELIDFLEAHGEDVVNCCKLPVEGEKQQPSLFTPLHYAAINDAPNDVIEKLISIGASKVMNDAEGKTPFDHGFEKRLSPDKVAMLEIPQKIKENLESIRKMETGLHSVINGRVAELIKKNGQILPNLAFLFEKGSFYYPVPGMYGGFNVTETQDGIQADSWIRICGGSEQNHAIDKEGNVTLLPDDNPL